MNFRQLSLCLSLVFVLLFALFFNSLHVFATEQSDEDIIPSTFLGEEVPLYNGDSNSKLRATVIDGYNVYQKYNDGNNSVSFDNEVPKGVNIDYLYVQINFPKGVPRDTLFDLTVRFTHSKATEFEAKAMTLYDESTQTSKSIKSNLTFNHQNGETVLTFKDIKVNFIADRCILRYSYSGYSTSAAFVHNVASINLAEVSNTSLISGIVDAVLNLPSLIADAFGSLFDIVVESLDFVWTAIVDLGDLLGGFIIDLGETIGDFLEQLGNSLLDGIKSFFIPDMQTLGDIKESFDNLLRSRFGALYEVIDLTISYAQSFTAREQGTITLPDISIPLGDETFRFGGYEVQIIPDGFAFIVQPLKMITSIVATCLFIDGMKKRFENEVVK